MTTLLLRSSKGEEHQTIVLQVVERAEVLQLFHWNYVCSWRPSHGFSFQTSLSCSLLHGLSGGKDLDSPLQFFEGNWTEDVCIRQCIVRWGERESLAMEHKVSARIPHIFKAQLPYITIDYPHLKSAPAVDCCRDQWCGCRERAIWIYRNFLIMQIPGIRSG